MREADAQAVLLVRAFEEADADGRLLSGARRTRGTRDVRELLGERATDEQTFVVQRAHELLPELQGHVPGLERVLAASRVGAGLVPTVLVLALAIGLLSNALGPTQQINVLFAPMLGLVAWNLLVYLALALAALTGKRASASERSADDASTGLRFAHALDGGRGFARRASRWLVDRAFGRSGVRRAEDQAVTTAALARFARSWGAASRALATARVTRLLHVAAVLIVGGAVAGMYVRGLGLLYRATWQSTFLQAEQVNELLRVVLGPAAAVLGAAVPDVAPLQHPGDGDAAPWIHLYAVTGLLFVALPRTVLALHESRRIGRLEASLQLDLDGPYFRRLLSPTRGRACSVDVVPYGLRPDARTRDALSELLHDVLGARAELRLGQAQAYGDEAAAVELSEADDEHPAAAHGTLVVFPLAQSPEAEVHAVFVEELRARMGDEGRLAVLVEGSGFRQRVGDAARRIDERRRAWDRVLREVDVTPVHVELDRPIAEEPVSELARSLRPAAQEPAS